MREILRGILRTLFRLLPFFTQVLLSRGKPNLALWIRPVPRKFTIDYFLGDVTIQIDPVSDAERGLFSGTIAADAQAVFARFVQAGHTVIDVGAGVGNFTLALAKAVGVGGRVEAFEPAPLFFARLESNLNLNPDLRSRVRTHRLGLAEARGSLVWQPSVVLAGAGNAGSSTHVRQFDSRNPVIEVPAHPLDSFVHELELAKIDFIKISVDGAELEVVSGARATLEKFHPILFIEVDLLGEASRARASALDLFLRDLGYRIYKILPHSQELVECEFPDFSRSIVALPIANNK